MSQLWLDQNPISDKELQTIFHALKRNKTLKELSVYECGMTDAGVASLADALHTNNTLESLYIYGNGAITENGLTNLIEAVSRCSGLKVLYIPRHLGENEGRKIINEARRRNGQPGIEVWGY